MLSLKFKKFSNQYFLSILILRYFPLDIYPKMNTLTIDPGTRVVRGPDWNWGDQDGGEGMYIFIAIVLL